MSQRKKKERKKVAKTEDDVLFSDLSLNVAQIDINKKTCKNLTATNLTETIRTQSRIKEQANLICVLKERSDEMFNQCQSLQQVKNELEKQLDICQKEVMQKQKRVELVEKRFMDLDSNSRAIIVFMEEYKHQNAHLKIENKQLQMENDTLFSQKIQDKTVIAQRLTKEIKMLKEEFTTKEKAYKEKVAQTESTSMKQFKDHLQREAVLLEQFREVQQQHEAAEQTCKVLKQKALKAEEQHTSKEAAMGKTITNLTKEREKLLHTTAEQDHTIQEKLHEIRHLEMLYNEQKIARTKAEERFKQDVLAVNADKRVRALKLALEKAKAKYDKLNKDYAAFKEHSINLITKERELNKILRHLRT
ncbi:coiled-coil domain-containing protein 89 [Stigmatopora nigra]